jgi:hypothetical protein
MQPEGVLPDMHFYEDFIIAGQDAFALVAFLVYFTERMQIKALNLQISASPAPQSMIYIADAAAVKVCSLDCLSG